MRKRNKIWLGIREMIRPQLGAIVLLNLLAVLQALAQVALAVVTKSVIDAAVYGGALLQWAIVLGCLLLLLVAMHALNIWLAGSTSDKCIARMRHTLLDTAAHSSRKRLRQR